MQSMAEDAQSIFLQHVREYGEKHFTRESVQRWRKEQGLPDEVVQEFVNLEFNPISAVFNSEEGRSLHLAALTIEELTRIAGATLPYSSDFLSLTTLQEYSTVDLVDSMKAQYQKTGRLSFSMAVSEPSAGSDSHAIATVVTKSDGKYILNGHKTFVNNGEYAPWIFVVAQDQTGDFSSENPSLSFWLMPKNLEGIRSYPIEKTAQRIVPFSDIVFDNVELDASCYVSGGRDSYKKLFLTFEFGRVLTCASVLGLAQAAMDDAMSRAHTRISFGSKISEFQLIKEKLTDMEIKLTNMRNLTHKAAKSIDENISSASLDVTLMKRYVPKTAVEVASDAIQIFGGLGYTEKARVFSIWEDCRGAQIAEGTDEIMVHIAGNLLAKKYGVS